MNDIEPVHSFAHFQKKKKMKLKEKPKIEQFHIFHGVIETNKIRNSDCLIQVYLSLHNCSKETKKS